MQAALEEDILILTSEDSTDSGTEETQKRNKISNLKMVNTVELKWLRFGINSNYLMNKCVTNNLISRQEKDKAKKKKRRHPNYSNLNGTYYNQPTYKTNNIILKNLQKTNVKITQLARGSWWTKGAPVRGRSSVLAFIARGYVHKTHSNIKNFIPNSCINRWSYRGALLLQPWSLEGNTTTQETKPSGAPLTQDSLEGEEEEGEAGDGHDSVIQLPGPGHSEFVCLVPNSKSIFASVFTQTGTNLNQEALNPTPPGSPKGRTPGSPGSGQPPPLWAPCITIEINKTKPYKRITNPSGFKQGGTHTQGRNIFPRVSTPSTHNNTPSNPKNPKQKSITDFII